MRGMIDSCRSVAYIGTGQEHSQQWRRMGHVLLIEGHRLMRSAIIGLLAQSGHQVIEEAADPLEGVRRILWQPPRVMIVDTVWPEIKGIWLSRFLRELAPQSKIVLLVDDSLCDDPEAARSSGADAFVAKEMLSKELTPILAQWNDGEDGDELSKWSMA